MRAITPPDASLLEAVADLGHVGGVEAADDEDGRAAQETGEQEWDGGVPGRKPADDGVGSSHGPPGGERPGEWARLGVLTHVVAFRKQVTVDHDEACRPTVDEENACHGPRLYARRPS